MSRAGRGRGDDARPAPHALDATGDGGTAVPTLLVDGHPVVRAGLRAFLERHASLRIVGEADGLAHARAWLRRVVDDDPGAERPCTARPAGARSDTVRLDAARADTAGADTARATPDGTPMHGTSQLPQLVIVDLELHDGTATELIPDILRRAPQARILILSSLDEEDAVRTAMRAGAHGWLDKQQDPSALADAVRAALRGEPAPATEAVLALAAPPRSAPFDELTPRERQVLDGIANGWSNREIAERLGVHEKTVKTHAGHVYAKLGVERRTQAALLARELGVGRPGGRGEDGAVADGPVEDGHDEDGPVDDDPDEGRPGA